MRHPTDGLLRRLIDEPAGVAEADREHAAACSQCGSAIAAMREDALAVSRALATDAGAAADTAAAWQRLSASVATTTAPPRPALGRGRGRYAALLRRPAVAALAAAVVLTGAGTAAANGWLRIFSTERVATVSFSTADLVRLPDLSAYGDVVVTDRPEVHKVPDAATAERESGIDVPEVADLPRGVGGKPVYQVGSKVTATFTFSTERAARAAAAAGDRLPPPPRGLDGSSMRLVAGPGVAQLWSSNAGAPALLVGRAVAPTAYSSGVEFEVMRDYLLSLPGMPADVAAQLRAFAADGSTLPLPVPSDEVTTSSTEVDGAPATLLEARDRTMAAVVWVDDGAVTVVAGSLDADEVLTVARELR